MERKEILKNLIVYFTFKVPNITPTKLIKLIYLADLLHYEKHRRKISNVEFFNYHYGPWHPIIELMVVKECGELVEIKSVQTRKGEVIKIHKPKVKEANISFPGEGIFDTLKAVVNKWGDVNTNKIVKYIKNRSPFIETCKGQVIDFTFLDPEFKESIKRASNQAKESHVNLKSTDDL